MMTRDEICALFDYVDGNLYWKTDRYANKVCGKKAGAPNSGGYVHVKVDGVLHKVHRLVWVMHGREVPSGYVIDHINGNPKDNRLENLRLATRQQNNCNSVRRVDNSSGVKGVSWHKPSRKWIAQIQHAGKKIHVGLYASLQDAAQAVASMRATLHGAFSRS